MVAQAYDDDVIAVGPGRPVEILPKRMYLAKVVDITQDVFTPKKENLKEGESSAPYNRVIVSWLIRVPGRKDPYPFTSRLKDQPDRGPRAALSKFIKAVEDAGLQMRKSQLVGRYFDILMEDTNPMGGPPVNFVAEFFVKMDVAQDTKVIDEARTTQVAAPTEEEIPGTDSVPF